ncbi:MAG: DeoR/GlpR family DNA-binding transcription regulator [Verrucomicrobiota bacterium JB022]|nr:DeoR/GlpR family DNA-binding transcription regulator [Verrucomicrobiota bacterium JB022]
MLTPERHRAILRILAEDGKVTITDLVERLDISPATARRDASALAASGKALRSHGGLLPARYLRQEPHYRAKAQRWADQKERLAQKAAAIIPHEGNIFVDGGTTCLEVGKLLLDRTDLRIFTNSIPLLSLADESRAALTAIGGEVRRVSMAMTGALAQAWLSHLRFDFVVVGASGFSADHGAYTTEIHEAAVKSEVLRRATGRMLVAEAEKLNQPTAVHFAPWCSFSHFISGKAVPPEVRRSIASEGVRIHLV